MIIHLKKEAGTNKAQEIAKEINAFLIERPEHYILISGSIHSGAFASPTLKAVP